MAFHFKDSFMSYVKRGDADGLLNIARADDDNEGLKFYAFMNEVGSYVIQRISTSGTLKIYEYYAKRGGYPSDMTTLLNTDWTNRASLSYVDYYSLFHQE